MLEANAGLDTPLALGVGAAAAQSVASLDSAASTESTPSLAATSGPSTSSFNDRVQNAIKDICKQYGGPRQFLQHHLGTTVNTNDFRTKLFRMLPKANGITYQTTLGFPVSVDPNQLDMAFVLHPGDFSWLTGIMMGKFPPTRPPSLKTRITEARKHLTSNSWQGFALHCFSCCVC